MVQEINPVHPDLCGAGDLVRGAQPAVRSGGVESKAGSPRVSMR